MGATTFANVKPPTRLTKQNNLNYIFYYYKEKQKDSLEILSFQLRLCKLKCITPQTLLKDHETADDKKIRLTKKVTGLFDSMNIPHLSARAILNVSTSLVASYNL